MPGVVLAVRWSRQWDICLEVYLRHGDDGTGACLRCRVPAGTCLPRRRAAFVLAAIGVDLAQLEPGVRRAQDVPGGREVAR